MSDERPFLTVTELTRKIKQVLETGFSGLLVQGELSNVKLHSSGHLYFTLKDDAAQIAGVMWRSRVGGLSFRPEDGMKVIISGRLSVYEPRGSYQIDASSMRPLGIGELQIAFEQLKEKLAAEGLFEESRKRPIPRFATRVGIITSPTGAALHDMLRTLRKRFPGVEAILRPVRVQGPGASAEIAEGIADFNRFGGVDVLIVGRGGGSLEDLWAFNEEVVARAIAGSVIPVISAVGHETDFTIADFVADQRAPTPTAAAAIAVPDRRALVDHLRNSAYTMHDLLEREMESAHRTIIHLLKSHAFNRPLDLLRQLNQRIDELHRGMTGLIGHRIEVAQMGTNALERRLAALGPEQVLRRGFAIVSRGGAPVSEAAALRVQEEIDIRFHDGTVGSIVTRSLT